MPCMELNSFHALLRKSGIKLDMRTQCIVLAAVLTAVLPLELHHLVAALVGAAAYMLLQKLDATVQRRPVQSSVHKAKQAEKTRSAADRRTPAGRKGLDEVTAKPEVRKPSVMPVQAPKFKANSWEAEVGELVDQISLTDTSRAHVESITEAVRTTLLPVLPTARVDGYVTANPMGGTAFGVAVPDVEIVVLSNPKVLAERATKDAGKFQKALIRTCTDRLVSHGSFKFRRSAFRGTEPKVTLISPTTGGQVGIPFNLAVNAATPARSSAVFEACSRLDLRAGELILLVRRWAKDRGISHAAKGHLSPYSWMLLAVYYLQVGLDEHGPLLPDMSFLASGKRPAKPDVHCALSTGELLKGFMHFYATFGWGSEIVSVRRATRLPPNDRLPRRLLEKDGSKTHEAPIIEDPFEGSVDLGSSMHWLSTQRLVEEFARSAEFCSRGASLAELLEPWTPPEQEEEEA